MNKSTTTQNDKDKERKDPNPLQIELPKRYLDEKGNIIG